jgi:hypothetical protein
MYCLCGIPIPGYVRPHRADLKKSIAQASCPAPQYRASYSSLPMRRQLHPDFTGNAVASSWLPGDKQR